MELTLNNGITMPALGLGVFQSAPEQTTAAVEAALAAGYRHIDTAAAYGNEREVGQGVRRSGVDRSAVFIETKVWVSDYGYEQSLHAWEKAVGKLGVDYLDLLILHQPAPDRFDKTIAAYKALETPAGRRAGAGDRRQQLHATPPEAAARRDRHHPCGQPDRAAPLLHPAGRPSDRRRARDPHPGPGRRSAASPSTPAGAVRTAATSCRTRRSPTSRRGAARPRRR
jgi:hypothetical protein